MNPAIPQPLQSDIQQLVQSLTGALGEDLVSIVIYGGMAKNKSIKETDTIKLMVVIREVRTDVLDRLAAPYMKHKRCNQIQLLTLSEEDLRSSTDVFPIKFLDMQQDYEVLAGQDVVAGLEISKDNLRIRCEQELKNLMLRLRQTYINHSSKPKMLSGTMTKSYFAFLNGLDVLAELSTGNVYRQDDEILNAGEELGLNMTPFRRVKELRDGHIFDSTDEQKTTYEELMATVRQAASMADKLES
jgi:hypothetical protein|tara:strand:+ start:32 stop:763 length:732 start_codon:yes stop_codon:yes gene_type:complete